MYSPFAYFYSHEPFKGSLWNSVTESTVGRTIFQDEEPLITQQILKESVRTCFPLRVYLEAFKITSSISFSLSLPLLWPEHWMDAYL